MGTGRLGKHCWVNVTVGQCTWLRVSPPTPPTLKTTTSKILVTKMLWIQVPHPSNAENYNFNKYPGPIRLIIY